MSIEQLPQKQLTNLHRLRDANRQGWVTEERKKIERRFAECNNWRPSKYSFDFECLRLRRRIGGRFGCCSHPFLDHGLWYLQSYRPIAIVGQPYDNCDVQFELAMWADDLVIHEPPARFASFWYPGATRFIVFTRPGVDVQFLPEQADKTWDTMS